MIRLQHYIEFCYLAGGLVWAVELWRLYKFKMYGGMKIRDYIRALALLAFAPVMLVFVAREAYGR